MASSPRAGAVGSGALCPPLSGSRDGGDPSEAPGSGEPLAPSSQPAGGSRVPAPPVTGATSTKKACSQVPCRKNLTSSRRCPEPDAGCASPKPEGAEQRRGPCSPIWLPGSPLRALSTNNCNNTRGQDSLGTGGGKSWGQGVLGCLWWVWGPNIAPWLQGHRHSLGLSPLGMLPGHPGRSRTGARRLGEW